MRTLFISLLFSATLLADSSFLPLKEGNYWTYRERGRQTTFTIQVGASAVIDGNVYHRLTGYATQPLWVRFGDRGALYFRDGLDRDVLLTSFEPFTGGWFNAPIRICDQLGQVQDKRGEHRGPTGPLALTLVIQYRTIGCADAGVEQEQFSANIGMVERTETTIAGPRTYDLVSARVGASTIETGVGASFTVSAQGRLATLELKVGGPTPIQLRYLSSQEFDLVVRREDGSVAWIWSADKLFLAVVRDEKTLGRVWQEEMPRDRVPAGRYELEAWITSGSERPQFAAAVPIQIQD